MLLIPEIRDIVDIANTIIMARIGDETFIKIYGKAKRIHHEQI